MGSRRLSVRRIGVAALLIGVVGAAFGVGARMRATLPPDPVRLERGIPVGTVESPGGALAAADNFVSAGVTASVEPGQLSRFLKETVDLTAHGRFVVENPAPGSGPPPGARVIGSVVAQRLESYGAGTARVGLWVVAMYWRGGAVPTQYWSLDELTLHWSADRWRVVSGQDSLPGPVPALIAGPRESRTNAVWDQLLTGMSAPYYGAG